MTSIATFCDEAIFKNLVKTNQTCHQSNKKFLEEHSRFREFTLTLVMNKINEYRTELIEQGCFHSYKFISLKVLEKDFDFSDVLKEIDSIPTSDDLYMAKKEGYLYLINLFQDFYTETETDKSLENKMLILENLFSVLLGRTPENPYHEEFKQFFTKEVNKLFPDYFSILGKIQDIGNKAYPRSNIKKIRMDTMIAFGHYLQNPYAYLNYLNALEA